MNITSSHIHHVIKAYGNRIGKKNADKLQLTGSGRRAPDIISISTEAKRRQVIDQITHDIISMAKGHDVEQDSIAHSISGRLGEKLGVPMDLLSDENRQVDFRFRVLSSKEAGSETIKELSIKDLKSMVEDLYSDEINDGE